MRRGEVYWADLSPPAGRRPICVLTRDAAIPVLSSIMCAPITRTVRGIRSEVLLDDEAGLPERCAINCDSVLTVQKSRLDGEPVGRLGPVQLAQLDAALRYALDIVL